MLLTVYSRANVTGNRSVGVVGVERYVEEQRGGHFRNVCMLYSKHTPLFL